MRDFDTLLRETLHDERWALPLPAGTLGAIESRARRTRRRRRTMVAGAVAVAATIALVLGMIGIPGTDPPPDPVSPRNTIPFPGLAGTLDDIAASRDSLYTLNMGVVHRIDRRTQKVMAVSPQLPLEATGEGRRPPIELGQMEIVGQTLWVGAVDSPSFPSAPPQTKMYGLDASTLEFRASVPGTGVFQFAVIDDTLWSLNSVGADRWQLVRRDLRTGAAEAGGRGPFTCAGSPLLDLSDYYIAQANVRSGVLWIICQSEDVRDENRWAAIALDFKTGTERGRAQLGRTTSFNGPAFGPAPDGSLWVLEAERVDKARFTRLSPAGRKLPTGKFADLARLEPFNSALKPVGSRLWLQTATRPEITCLDRGTGEILANYPVPPRSSGGWGLVAGDDHEVYTVGYNKIFVLRGPDRCLS